MNTIITGTASGFVGLWSLDSGDLLDSARLHGPIRRLSLTNGRLQASSELGQRLERDYSAFYRPYCELIRDVWGAPPVVMNQGRPVRRNPPNTHPCQESR